MRFKGTSANITDSYFALVFNFGVYSEYEEQNAIIIYARLIGLYQK